MQKYTRYTVFGDISFNYHPAEQTGSNLNFPGWATAKFPVLPWLFSEATGSTVPTTVNYRIGKLNGEKSWLGPTLGRFKSPPDPEEQVGGETAAVMAGSAGIGDHAFG
ncbi:hypothetical protein N7492_001432 [Penicillium capsulatum]|uniref:Uncharacterized protein n=1 Tax=Penicillium capsulatum TaxID=69766 RepID=A0A9W9IUP3_9EURO|nr:hypothetical protein N7492_001432 [Penicillium capsulatum]KAJ6129511.1 hypothetical protein N7512_002291 [Penicillium capsulatum]